MHCRLPLFQICLQALLLICLGSSCQAASSHVVIHKQGFELQGQPYYVLGVNYYPQKTPWSLFWQHFDAELVTQDFQRIQTLGFNTVRIFVPFQQFGGAQLRPDFKAQLQQLLDIAEQQQLHVVVTLFDFFQAYDEIERSQAHLQAVVSGLEGHPAILAWDLKNEGDLDYQQDTQRVVLWLQSMAQTLRALPVQQLITAGWSSAENVTDVASALDYLTFHDYRPEGHFSKRLLKLQEQSRKPIVLGEFGYHTWADSPSDPHPLTAQFNYFQVMLFSVLRQNLAGAMAWTLYDFDPQLREAWVLQATSEQHFLGLLDQQGQAKPGLQALLQHVYLRDAQSQGAVSLDSHEIELVFRAHQAGQAELQTQSGKTLVKSQKIQVHVGVNSYRWQLQPEEIRDLIYLKKQLFLYFDGLSSVGGQRLKAKSFPLQLRQG